MQTDEQGPAPKAEICPDEDNSARLPSSLRCISPDFRKDPTSMAYSGVNGPDHLVVYQLVIVAFGTRGDVQPLFILACKLASYVQTLFISHDAFALTFDWGRHGLAFAGTPTDPNARPETVAEEYEVLIPHASRCECLVFNLFALGAWHVAEAFSKRAIAASPCLIPYEPAASFRESFRAAHPRLYA
eukprot:3495925-Pleurochrysis_carterae.AAC.2